MAGNLSQKLGRLILAVIVTCLVSACDKAASRPAQLDPVLVASTLNDLLDQVLVRDQISLMMGEQLNVTLSNFLESPTIENQKLSQQAWQYAHDAYLTNQIMFFVDPELRHDLVFALDAWPIQPGFLDSVPGYPDSGIINDVTIEVTPDTLRQQHGITDDEEVCLGFHAIEYLIFRRSNTDFIADKTQNAANILKMRRRELLKVVGNELVVDISRMSRVLIQQRDLSDWGKPNDQLLHILQSVRHHLLSAVRKSDYSADRDYGHSNFSGAKTISLGIELSTLQEFTLDEVNWLPVFVVLNETTASNYESTLREAVELTTDPNVATNVSEKLPLMLSALLHQLEEFESALLHRSSD